MSATNRGDRLRAIGGALLLSAATMVAACSPKPPPDLVKPQREALDRAKAVEGSLLKQADEQRRTIDAASR